MNICACYKEWGMDSSFFNWREDWIMQWVAEVNFPIYGISVQNFAVTILLRVTCAWVCHVAHDVGTRSLVGSHCTVLTLSQAIHWSVTSVTLDSGNCVSPRGPHAAQERSVSVGLDKLHMLLTSWRKAVLNKMSVTRCPQWSSLQTGPSIPWTTHAVQPISVTMPLASGGYPQSPSLWQHWPPCWWFQHSSELTSSGQLLNDWSVSL